jgi:hypothetical protein
VTVDRITALALVSEDEKHHRKLKAKAKLRPQRKIKEHNKLLAELNAKKENAGK